MTMNNHTAYLDKLTGDIITVEEWNVMALGVWPREMGLQLVFAGGGAGKGIACECDKCGSPIGGIDPEDAAWVRLGVCPDCRD